MKRILKLGVLCLMLNTSNCAMAVEKNVDMSYQCEKVVIEESKQDISMESIKGVVKLPLINEPSTKFTKDVNKKLEIWVKEWVVDLEDLSKKYQEDVKKNANMDFMPFEIDTSYTIKNEKCPYLSLYIDYYQFTGGAHGITTRKTYNYDLNAEKELTIGDLFKEGYNYKEIINKEINKQIEKNKDSYFMDVSGFKGISDNQMFTFNNKEITIYFQLYEIAPYSSGLPAFNIPYETLKDGLLIK